jgi:hypothetical protein
VVTAGLDRVGAVRLAGWRDRNALIGEGGAFWIADNKPRIEFATDHVLSMKRAFLIPQESDGLVKVSDGQKVYVLDAERVVWMEIG